MKGISKTKRIISATSDFSKVLTATFDINGSQPFNSMACLIAGRIGGRLDLTKMTDTQYMPCNKEGLYADFEEIVDFLPLSTHQLISYRRRFCKYISRCVCNGVAFNREASHYLGYFLFPSSDWIDSLLVTEGCWAGRGIC
jgi:hypothetical protein